MLNAAYAHVTFFLRSAFFSAALAVVLAFGFYALPAHSIDTPPAVPVVEVEQEVLAPPPGTQAAPAEQRANSLQPEAGIAPQEQVQSSGPVVIELFSSQACSFCPKADALIGDLARIPGLIALSCHVDYFDVKTGSLSLPFCSSRQIEYESTLRAGPKYTPQMVVNGEYDVVGYRRTDVYTTIKRARKERTLVQLDLKSKENSEEFEVLLPNIFAENKITPVQDVSSDVPSGQQYQIYVIVYDKPHEIKVSEGANAGKTLVYTNVIRNVGVLGPWDGTAQNMHFNPKMTSESAGFAVLISSLSDGHIVAVAQYTKS